MNDLFDWLDSFTSEELIYVIFGILFLMILVGIPMQIKNHGYPKRDVRFSLGFKRFEGRSVWSIINASNLRNTMAYYNIFKILIR